MLAKSAWVFFVLLKSCSCVHRMSSRGALQLAIDAEAIKTCLLQFPSTSKHETLNLSSYNSYVEREMGITISLVKAIQSKPEDLVENYLVLMPETAQNVVQFQKVLDVKVRNFCTFSRRMLLSQSPSSFSIDKDSHGRLGIGVQSLKKMQQSDLIMAYQKRLSGRSIASDTDIMVPGQSGAGGRGFSGGGLPLNKGGLFKGQYSYFALPKWNNVRVLFANMLSSYQTTDNWLVWHSLKCEWSWQVGQCKKLLRKPERA